MARPRGARRISESDERESCNNVSGLLVEQFCSGPTWVSARIQADYRQDLSGPFWHPVSWLRRADRSSISSFHLADLGGEAIDSDVLSLRVGFDFLMVEGSGEAIPSEPPSLARPMGRAMVAERGGRHPLGGPERAFVRHWQ